MQFSLICKMVALLWLTCALLPTLSIAYNPTISNGTCYYGPGKQAADNFIPCGNAAGGVQSCCQARDVCLSSNACFNGQYYVTYLAGCTDQGYDDAKCPYKGQFPDEQWVGLVRCGVSNGTGEQWGPCNEPTQPMINKGNQQCTCDPASSTAVFTDAATLTNIASLPVSAGNAIAFYSGFQPSTISSPSTTNAQSSSEATNAATSGSSIGSSNQPSSTVLPSSSPPTLSSAAKAGIGVGSVAGVLAFVTLLGWFVWHRRRKDRSVPPVKDQIRPSSVGSWGPVGSYSVNGIVAAAGNHKDWGRTSELPTAADEVTTTKTSLGENTVRSAFNTPTTTYQPYHHSPTTGASEMDASPAASTSRLAHDSSSGEKLERESPVYELPG